MLSSWKTQFLIRKTRRSRTLYSCCFSTVVDSRVPLFGCSVQAEEGYGAYTDWLAIIFGITELEFPKIILPQKKSLGFLIPNGSRIIITIISIVIFTNHPLGSHHPSDCFTVDPIGVLYGHITQKPDYPNSNTTLQTQTPLCEIFDFSSNFWIPPNRLRHLIRPRK